MTLLQATLPTMLRVAMERQVTFPTLKLLSLAHIPINQLIPNTTNRISLSRLRQENGDFKGSLSYTERCFKMQIRILDLQRRLRG